MQEAIVETLCAKALRALQFTGLTRAGGVPAGWAPIASCARVSAAQAAARGARVYYPRPEFCTDNAAMIAVAGLQRLRCGEHAELAIAVRARWPLEELRAPGRVAPLSATSACSARVARWSQHDDADRIFLRGLTVECIIGFIDWERRMRADRGDRSGAAVRLSPAPHVTDASADTIDYKNIAKRVLAWVGASRVPAGRDAGASPGAAAARGVSACRGCA